MPALSATAEKVFIVLSLLLVGEVDVGELDGVIRLGQDHRQREHAENETNRLADLVVVDQLIERVLEVVDSVITNYTVQGCVIFFQDFRLNKINFCLIIDSWVP